MAFVLVMLVLALVWVVLPGPATPVVDVTRLG
jgi:hypothetical protein